MKQLLIATAAFAACASPALAKKEKVVFVTAVAVKDKPAITLDPACAYVLLRSNVAMPVHLMRIPSDEDQVKYDALKAEAFTEAREKYAKKKASYDKAKAAYDKSPKGAAKPVVPEKPVEPTEANFEFTPFGLMTGVPIGPLFRFAKGEGALRPISMSSPPAGTASTARCRYCPARLPPARASVWEASRSK